MAFRIIRSIFFLLLSTALVSCASARKPVPPGVIPEKKPVTVSDEQYGHQILATLSERYPLDYNNPRMNEVMNIVDRLTKAARADLEPWHVYIFRDANFKNAAATRGNHVFIWSALFDSTKNEEELAVVLSHEISHVIAGHTDPDPNEELKKLLIGVGAMAAGIAVSQATANPSVGQNVGQLASDLTEQIGSGFLVYPYNRERELEADQIGLFMMANAGYNPETAISFWNHAQHDPAFSEGLSFLSTHPPAKDRLENLHKLLPQAVSQFKTNGSSSNQINESLWVVSTSRAILYESPNTSSKKIGEFSHNAEVSVINVTGQWLEIIAPDHGYLNKRDLKPKN